MTTKQIKPSDLIPYEEITEADRELCTHLECCAGQNPALYGWYFQNGKYFPHRKASLMEQADDEFN